ncbi:hypothetical protein ABZX30_31400, partial [Streptomyces sp. NPDC004542]
MGDLRVSEAMNGVLIALVGSALPEASETGARISSEKLAEFGRRMKELQDDIGASVAYVDHTLPGDAGRAYKRAMSVLTGADGGTNHLREYERSLRDVAQGHRDQSLNIQESKWQIIAELIRLLLELLILAATAWINPAAAGEAAAAKARSKVALLTALDLFLRRTHLMPSLSEALEEAFQTLVVRLGMMVFNDSGWRPSGVDWRAVGQSAAFGGTAGWLSGPLRDMAGRFNGLFSRRPGEGLFKDVTGDVTSKAGRELPGNGHANASVGERIASSARRVPEFVADGLTEALPESLLAMAFFGTPFSWSAFATSFWTSGVSELSTGLLHEGVGHGAGGVREAFDDARRNSAVGGDGAVFAAPRGGPGAAPGAGAEAALHGTSRSSSGGAVNAVDALDRLGVPTVTAPAVRTASGAGHAEVTDAGPGRAARTASGPEPRPVAERAVPHGTRRAEQPARAEGHFAGNGTAPDVTARPAAGTAGTAPATAVPAAVDRGPWPAPWPATSPRP